MLARHRKLTFGTLCNEGHSEGCILLGKTAVYRRLMDPTSHCYGPTFSPYAPLMTNDGGSRGCIVVRKRFEKSESEDSGVELPPPSPFGSESSYNPDESESLESSTPEYSESLDGPTPEVPESPKSTNIESQGSLAKSEETVILNHPAVENTGSFNMHSDKDVDTMEHFFTQQRERDMSGVPQKLEQAILRSRRRSTSRESIQNRTSRYHRQYVGSLKEQRRGKTFTHQTKSPTRHSQDQDPLLLPGDGLRYLESLCQMLEQIAELQEKNQRLQQEKKEAEGKRHNQVPVLFLDSCVCGASRASRDSDNDLTDNPHPIKKIWEPKHYRKRSSSHAGVLLSIARPNTVKDNGLKQANKMDPQYVSVPNLQEGEKPRPHRNCKTEASQWHKVKDMLSKFARKGASHGSGQTVEPRNNCRTQTVLEGNAQHSRRLFLPGLVIRPRNHGRQFH
ncbi:uncharacterized protein C8orf58 homolog isoform X2 [Phyllobates terribilis]|uniref:uncharacterized protein C8orf58 homolog isoform X2 n=1 Tax=Phyllobates terribilis TaxID=111132 RepID=UPI003CCB426A